MAVSINETETKYEAPLGMHLPRLDDLPQVAATSGPQEEELEAEYYDTDDLRLIRAGVTLRRRRGGPDPGWHLKLPLGPNARREIRLPLGRAGRSVPQELAALVRVHTRGKPLRPVAHMTTKRQRVTLLDKAGESLAEVADDDVSAQTLGDSTTVSQWREIEVELTGGDVRLLKAADEVLRRDGLRPAGNSAKLERALGRARQEPAAASPLSASSPASEVVLAYLREQSAALKSLDPMVRGDEPDAVHQMRVATRRLRSALQSFGRVIRRSQTQHLAGELKWLAGVLGAARDAEVLSGHLRENLNRTPVEQVVGPVQARVQAHFAPLRARAQAGVITVLDSQQYFALLDELDALLADPPLGPEAALPAGQVLPAAVRRAYRKTSRRMRRARQAPPGRRRDVALHEARKAAKRARYAGEAVAPAVGKAGRFAKRMKKMQSVLGEHQDTVIARQVVRELGMSAHLAGENAFSYGLLHERESHNSERLRAQARKAWKKSSRRRYRRWMSR